jgi:hypothetical protein
MKSSSTIKQCHQRSKRLALAIMDAGIKLVAVDFDRTIVNIHTGGRYKQSASMLSSHYRPFFKKFLKEAQKVGLWVAVVTFSAQTALVADSMSIALGGESNINRCYLRGDDGSWVRPSNFNVTSNWRGRDMSRGKLGHIYSVCDHIQKLSNETISPTEILYIDDDLANVDIGRKAGICHSAWCPATYEPNSCNKLLWFELEGKYLNGIPLNVMSNTAEVEDEFKDGNRTKTRLCSVM